MISQSLVDCISKASEYKGVSRIGIFGSFARAEQSDDIDILYDYHYIDNDNNGISDTFQFLDILESDLIKHLGDRDIDFISYHAILDSNDDILKQNVMRDVVWVYEQK
ncbi:MAG: hypothetical protein FWE11_02805 [Defluviitaleaceae bacterium]|nr:hypothetical protein [Defluviitaleaceae bacterium]